MEKPVEREERALMGCSQGKTTVTCVCVQGKRVHEPFLSNAGTCAPRVVKNNATEAQGCKSYKVPETTSTHPNGMLICVRCMTHTLQATIKRESAQTLREQGGLVQ